MAGPYRLSAEIISHAEESAALQMRSVPKQIEFWAEVGRRVEKKVDHVQLMAIIKDMAIIDVRPIQSEPVDVDEVLGELETDRANGRLAKAVTRAGVVYEASASHPGLLDRIDEQGQRTTGFFTNGEFVPGTTRPGTATTIG